MANRGERVLEQVRKQELVETAFLNGLGEISSSATPVRQGKFIRSILKEVKTVRGSEACKNMMRPCGHQCISDSIISTAKELYAEADRDIDKFLSMMNERHIGGGHLHTESGAIIGIYESCYCGIPKQVKDLPPEYCECSAGWFERLFSEVFERQVEVKILQTILSGGDQCRFQIFYE